MTSLAERKRVNSAHPSNENTTSEMPNLVNEIDNNSDRLPSVNSAHPSSVNSAHLPFGESNLMNEIDRKSDGCSIFNSAHPSLDKTSRVFEIHSSTSDQTSVINSAHPPIVNEIEVVVMEPSFPLIISGAHPSIKQTRLVNDNSNSDIPSVVSGAHPSHSVNNDTHISSLKGESEINSAHSSFIIETEEEEITEMEISNDDHLLRAYSNLFHSKITHLMEYKWEENERAHPSFSNPVHAAYLQWLSGVDEEGRNKPPEVPELGAGSQVPEVRLVSGDELLERVSSVLNALSLVDNDLILQELSDIRHLLLQQLLSSPTGSETMEPEALKMLTKELSFPVGEWSWSGCRVCLERKGLFSRPCCSLPVCEECLKRYLATRVGQGAVKIQCCNPECQVFVPRDEISSCLDPVDKARFYHFLARANADPWVKTCPRCSQLTSFAKVKPSLMKNTHKHPVRSRVVCAECTLTWCFACHAPWHPGFTCKQYRKGDRLMKSWANETHHGQLNAQKCPKCQVYIQRSTGCDHMHCTRCECDFCYRCGDRLRKLRFFGDHYSKLSVFGCKYRYKADQPLQRKLVRGAVFGSKVMVAPLLGTLGACAGVIALGFGIFILPVYGGVRLYQKFSPKLL